MPFSLFLNSLPESYLSFCSGSLDSYSILTYLGVLWVLFLFYFLVKVSFTRTVSENEHTQKRQSRAKRRRKGGTRKCCRYYQREEEEKKTLSFLKSPLGQHHDTIRFRQLLCPDPSCEVCNNATTEMDQLLFSLALEDATPCVCPLASTAPVTEPSFTLSPAVSAGPPRDLMPPPLPEPLPPPPSILSPNPVTPLGDFPSLSPSVHSLPPDTAPPLESEFTVDGSPPQPLAFPSLPPHDTENEKTPLTVNTIFHDFSIIQDINPSPDLAPTLNPNGSVIYHVPPTLSVSPSQDYNLTMTQPKPIHIPSKPALENSSPHSTGALSTYIPQGTDHPNLSISHFSNETAQAKDPLPSTLAQRDSNEVKDVGYDTEKDLNSHMMSLSGANSMVPGQSISQRQSENALKEHLSKKFEEINEGQLPATVHSSWHAIQQIVPAQSHTKIQQRSLPPTVGGEYCLNTSQELFFLESSVQQMLEAHITKFHLRMVCGLPTRVLESIEIFKLRDTSSHSLFNSKSSSTKVISKVDSKSRGFMPLQGSAQTLNNVCPSTSLVGQEGQETLRLSPSDIPHGPTEEVQRISDAGQTLLPVTSSSIDKAYHEQSPRANIYPPKLPTEEAGAGHEPEGQSVNSSQSKEMKNSEPVSKPSMSRAEELNALQSKMSDVLTTSKSGISQSINVNESRGVTTVRTESLPAKLSVLQDPNAADNQEQLMAELKWNLEKKHSEAQDQGSQMSQASNSLTYKASLTHARSVSSVDKAAPQVLHVHLEGRGVSMEQPQEPWYPKTVSKLCQDKNFPPAEKKVSPTSSTSKELGGGDAGWKTSQPKMKGFPTLGVPLKERLRSKSSQALSQKGQSPPESLFKKINQFLQWLHPGVKCKKEEHSQEKGSQISSAQSRVPVKSRADIRNFLEEKLWRRHAIDITCPQEPLSSAVKFGKAQHQAVVKAKTEPVQGHTFNSLSCKVTNTKSYSQEALFRDKDRHPQKVVGLKDQLLCQNQPHFVPSRGTAPCTSPTCRPPAAQGPPAALTTVFRGTVSRDPSTRCRQKTILEILQGTEFPTRK